MVESPAVCNPGGDVNLAVPPVTQAKGRGMSVQDQIETRLSDSLEPHVLEVRNESFMHNVPEGSETHFKVTLVSDQFDSLRKVRRHQMVYEILSTLMSGPIHALALHLYSPNEWHASPEAPDSPKCHGGET